MGRCDYMHAVSTARSTHLRLPGLFPPPPCAVQYGGENAGFCFSFDEPLSHLIYAACDIILVPSMFEPCGLTQVSPPALSPRRVGCQRTAGLCWFVGDVRVRWQPTLSSSSSVAHQSCARHASPGLLQMIAMRYGAVPVVRATGGLKDTGLCACACAGGCFSKGACTASASRLSAPAAPDKLPLRCFTCVPPCSV